MRKFNESHFVDQYIKKAINNNFKPPMKFQRSIINNIRENLNSSINLYFKITKIEFFIFNSSSNNHLELLFCKRKNRYVNVAFLI